MNVSEIDLVIEKLEHSRDLSVADYDGVTNAITYLHPDVAGGASSAELKLHTTDGAILFADRAYPNWSVNIHGRANELNGHWRCSLRESDMRDNDAAVGTGKSPVLSQAILAAMLRLTKSLKGD